MDVSTSVLNVSTSVLDVSTSVLDVSTSVLDVSTSVLDVSTSVLDVSTSVLDMSTSVLDVSTSVLGVSTSVLDVSTSVLDVSTSVLDVMSSSVLDVSTSVLDVSTSVLDVSTSVLDVSTSVLDVSTSVLDVSTSVLDVSTSVLDVSTSVLDVSTSVLDVSTSVLDVSTSVLDVCTSVLDVSTSVLDVSTSVLDVSTSVLDVSTSVLDVSTSVLDVSTSVLDVSTSVLDVSTSVLDVSTSVLDVSTSVLDVSTSVLDVSTSVLDVSTSVLDVSTSVLDVSTSVLDVSTSVLDVCTSVLDVSTSVLDVSTSVLDVSTSVLDVMSWMLVPVSWMLVPVFWMIIVGAPKGTFPGGLNYTHLGEPPVNTTGLVYLCPILNSSCEGLLGNGMSWDRKLFDEDPNVRANELLPGAPSNATVEDKERQFMGASMDSTGDMFVVCAPLWVNTYRHTQSDPDYRPQGRCYYSPRNLTGFHVIQPCNGGIVTSNDGDSQCTAGIAVTTLFGTMVVIFLIWCHSLNVKYSVELCVKYSVELCVKYSVELCVKYSVEPYVKYSVEPYVKYSVEPCVKYSVEPYVKYSVEPYVKSYVHGTGVEMVRGWNGTGLEWYGGWNGTGLEWYRVGMVRGWNGTGLEWYGVGMVRGWNGTRLEWYGVGMVQGWNGTGLEWYGVGMNDTFILGAPGQSSGSGALYYTPQLPQYSSPPFGGETILTYTESSFFSIGPTIPLSTYQGFTLATGNILDKVKKNLVTSYRQFVGSSYHELLKFYNASDPYVSIMTLPMGESPTENFGYSLVAADLNGDGWDEIIAGAPMYSTSSMLEIGRIYVFSNYDGTFMSNATVVVTGTISLGRFGHAIVNLGDINGDNCDDLAVSAPYASQNGTSSSSGVVYIFLGSNANLLNTVPFQTLDAADVMRANQLPELKSFGFSLASGVDVDGNLYNDLVIGALFSQTVVLYRTLSIALINVTLNAPDDVSIVMQNCSGYACFVVGICASYSGRGLAGPLGLNMEVREVVSGVQPKRLFFGAPVGKMNAYVSQFQFLSSGGVYCLSVVSYIENSSAGTTSLPFEVQVLFSPNSRNVTSSGPRPLLDLRQYPEINVTGNNTVQCYCVMYCSIRKNCNTATMCLPDLDLSLNQIVYSSGSGSTPSLVADVTKYINMSVKCASVKDDAFGSTLTATFPSYLELTSQNGLPSCATCWICLFPGNSTTSCTFEPFLLRANDSIQVELRWSVKSVTLLGNEKFNISVNVLVPNDIRTNNNEVTVPIAATAMAELSLELAVDQTSLQDSRAANIQPQTLTV
eukprot:Em0004g104a